MSDKDLAIMKEVGKLLSEKGAAVEIVGEDDFEEPPILPVDYDAVFTMLRGRNGIEMLKRIEALGIPTMNSSRGIVNAGRAKILTILSQHHIPMPTTVMLSEPAHFQPEYIKRLLSSGLQLPCWVKKGEGWAETPDDVVFVESCAELLDQTLTMHRRNKDGTVVLTSHLKGDIVKFYGVEGTDFFFWRYPDTGSSKFGLEAINGVPSRFNFDILKLKSTCDKAAAASGIAVYGGDCIVDEQGVFRIIDFNDWPSFSACREAAAKAIVQKLMILMGVL